MIFSFSSSFRRIQPSFPRRRESSAGCAFCLPSGSHGDFLLEGAVTQHKISMARLTTGFEDSAF